MGDDGPGLGRFADTMSSPIVIDIEAASELSVAMVENSVPLVARLSLTNASDATLSNLTVELALLPDFSSKWTAHISAIPPGGTFHLDTIELPLDRDRLVNQLERGRAELMLWVRDDAGDLPLVRVRARYGEGVFALDLDGIAAKFRKLARAFFLFAWWGLRGDRKALRAVARDGRLPANAEVADDLEQARAARDAATELARMEPRGREIFSSMWNGAESDAAALDRALTWSSELRRLLNAARQGLFGARVQPSDGHVDAAHDARAQLGELRASLATVGELLGFDLSRDVAAADPWLALRARIAGWRNALGQLRAWYDYLASSSALAEAQCGALVDAATRGELAPEDLPRSFEHSVYQAWLQRALAQEPVLHTFDGEQQLRHIAAFGDLDRKHLVNCAAAARARVSQRLPANTSGGTGGDGIVDIEAPVSLTVLARRVAPCFAIQRTSSRLEERLRAVLGRAVTIKNEIIWRVDQEPDAYAGVRLAPAEARREAPEVPLEEVANAAARVLRANIALSQDELLKLTAKSLGFPRASGRVAEHLSAAVALLVRRGRAKRDGDKVVLAS